MKKTHHKFAIGTKVRSPFDRRNGVVQGYDDSGWCLVGYSKTFAGHSGAGRVTCDKKYETHCWYENVKGLVRVSA